MGCALQDGNNVLGIVVVKTKQTVIIAKFEPPAQAGMAIPVVESVADYLVSTGY